MSCRAETTRCDLFSNFIANSWLNDLEGIGQDQSPLSAKHPLILVIILPNMEGIHSEL